MKAKALKDLQERFVNEHGMSARSKYAVIKESIVAADAYESLNSRPVRAAAVCRPARHISSRWGIVLAGGEGTRMRPLIRYWLGEARPKQYCTFIGTRSMLEHTIARARSVVFGNQILTVIGRGHGKFLNGSAMNGLPGRVLEQPGNLGTAPGVFLPAAYVLADNPEATLILLPADHFVHPENRFCDHMLHALEMAEEHHDRIILVGAVPDRAETGYGWIDSGGPWTGSGNALAHEPVKVRRFREKPGVKEARALRREGCLWNTMVISVKAKTLWALGRRWLPEMMYKFEAFLMVLRGVREGRLDARFEASALTSLYNDLEPADLSRDILEHVPEQSLVLRLDGVHWCDWGHPQRVTETLAGLGRHPSFSPNGLECPWESATLANESSK